MDTVCFSTNFDDYGVRRFGNELTVVSANKPDANNVISLDEVSGKPFSDVFRLNKCGLEDVLLLSRELNLWTSINATLNDSPISANLKGDLLFLSNNSGSTKNKLFIYYTKKIDGFWTTPKSVPMNNAHHNTTHPFYDEANDRLYFASDRKESQGGYDIFYVPFNDGNFGKVIAMEAINSKYSEVFPFVQNETLYFTSNNPENSLGALDVFFLENDEIINVGEPINSMYDDLAIMFETDTTGFVSSNRNSRGQYDDVFSFQIHAKEIIKENPVLVDEVTEEVVVPVETEVAEEIEEPLEPKKEVEKVEEIKEVLEEVREEEVEEVVEKVVEKEEKTKEKTIEEEKVAIPDKVVIFDDESHVNFAFDKYVVRDDFHEMLNEIAEIMKENSDLFILVSGHTDNVGSREYNLTLSKKRAQEVKKYLVMRGVNSVKIIVEYHAFDKPITTNETPEGRAKNRRTEVSFLGKVNPR